MTNPGQLTHGIPSRDPIKQLACELAALKRDFLALKAQTNTVTQYVTSDDNSAAFTSSWSPTYGVVGPFVVPPNCVNLTLFLWAAAGVTFAGAPGDIGVQVASGTSPSSLVGAGPPISISGAAGSATSVTTVFSSSSPRDPGTLLPGWNTPGTPWYFGVSAYANAAYTGSGNTHLNGVLIWTRS